MATLTASLQVKLDATLQNALDLVTGSAPMAYLQTFNFANGVGANQANNMFSDTRTLAASATEDLDLASGLTNAFGSTLVFTKVKAIIFKAASGNTNNVVISRPTANGLVFLTTAEDSFSLTPGAAAVFVWPDANGIAVTAGTGDLITVTNSAGTTSVTYDVIIIGIAS